MALERLVRKTTKENLWLYILSILKLKPTYGYELRDEIQRRFGFQVGEVTSYVVMYGLKRQGLVKVLREEARKQGLARKYYSITPEGKALLSKGVSYLRGLSERL